VFAVPNTLSTSAVETLRSGGETLRDSLLAAAGGVEERQAAESASAAKEGGTQERTSGVKLLLRIVLAMVRKGFFFKIFIKKRKAVSKAVFFKKN
jgi:hypothetical protein